MTWHGLEDKQLLDLWDHWLWRAKLATTLEAIAREPKASAQQRLDALGLLNTALIYGLVPEKYINYPELGIDVLVRVVSGDEHVRVTRRVRRLRAKIDEQLAGAQSLIRTAVQFVPLPADAGVVTPTTWEPKVGGLLS